MPLFTCWYSGVSWYFEKAASQSAADSGGSVPTMGCHSVMESPEWVRRVTPPTTTIANTSAQQMKSHAATARTARGGVSPRGMADVEGRGFANVAMGRIISWRLARNSWTAGARNSLETQCA